MSDPPPNPTTGASLFAINAYYTPRRSACSITAQVRTVEETRLNGRSRANVKAVCLQGWLP